MEKSGSDEQLLRYLDGSLGTAEAKELESQIQNSRDLQTRLEELRGIHRSLKAGARLEIPSKNFTQRVMTQLDRIPATRGFSPRNGILLLCGIVVAVGIALILLQSGKFDTPNGALSLDQLPGRNFIKNPLPSIPFNGKLVVNIIVMAAIGVSLVLLDRTILRPLFERRSGAI